MPIRASTPYCVITNKNSGRLSYKASFYPATETGRGRDHRSAVGWVLLLLFLPTQKSKRGKLDKFSMVSPEFREKFNTDDDGDNDGDGYTPAQGDCDDNDATIHHGATETCGDGIDQDCNGSDLSCSNDDDDDGGGGGGGGGCFISNIFK
ncbi:MAG: hypothetical protein COX19_11165 [Desulfobacterales bacterium CG23_combo_of_CG06-09_8_20_14_all_51_8]|nr:MAG: hypothetical protein COX19_11165 [Desulfobacterales bacterium CG23_combo_of_CG06-09_8_20_14_all_51_8]